MCNVLCYDFALAMTGVPCEYITPLNALEELGVGEVRYAPGCDGTPCERNDGLVADAVAISDDADAVIIFAGVSQIQEREKLDRTSLRLPGYQQQLIQAVAECTNGNKPVVLVVISGGPVDLSFAEADDRIQSILWAGYPGEAGGRAIADVIFGNDNPGTRITSNLC